ncbi:gibberellin 2-beta-dioxygenase 8 [Humulus lupulus]|uniref:gibberellin 2-beta-dioxygenase 8 n=1 Tax=Humulus lupulus TaxID=3486 RepID=UPI002B402BFD|nr:gibberellin 2-beta-dioxygenase 8 [Humulus lupulus]XP_062087518.1 gibberellin 2-beta-dioxygenase 8 [Humulus lupulus]XP_062087519.1 gibberellin 2-beta-dioxygenase 8 [Humulus lupulus]
MQYSNTTEVERVRKIIESFLNQPLLTNIMDSDPPLYKAYKTLFDKTINELALQNSNNHQLSSSPVVVVDECELPLIDLSRLSLGEAEREDCKSQIARASREWGFFQVINHGISRELSEKMRSDQEKVFKQPFDKKSQEDKYLKFSAGSYRWGTPTATCLRQLSWSEAFHIPLNSVSSPDNNAHHNNTDHFRSTVEQFAKTISNLALKLAEILAEKLGHDPSYFKENCLPSTCYLRMNRYPPCPVPSEVFGLMPHTDSDFLTILLQYNVGGLQLVKDGKWIAVKPNPDALIINIGDLFQAWSNDVYKSVEHRVVTNAHVERFSTAYFLCPSYDTVLDNGFEPSVYRKFSFREYRRQVQDDVTKLGFKIGLPRFLKVTR